MCEDTARFLRFAWPFFNIIHEKVITKQKTSVILLVKLHTIILDLLNPLNVNPRKWSDTFKQFVSNLPTNCLVCLTILWSWHLKGQNSNEKHHH